MDGFRSSRRLPLPLLASGLLALALAESIAADREAFMVADATVATDTTLTVTGLSEATTYSFAVAVFDTVGQSELSNVVSATTSPSLKASVLTVPERLARGASPASATLPTGGNGAGPAFRRSGPGLPGAAPACPRSVPAPPGARARRGPGEALTAARPIPSIQSSG